ncbi:MAG: DUF4412 domain-containing protein [Gammaproteobacteria bacterium]|nr:DUF4412 domain-containing protein [Gammaproteobacteria bacterium]
MLRTKCFAALALALSVAVNPAAADKVLTIANHTGRLLDDGPVHPAEDDTYTYWFGGDSIRYDMDETSVILRLDQKKFYFVNHDEKTYSTMTLPIDFEQLVGPEMAPMMQQMAQMMAAMTSVTPLDRSGSYAGHACKFYRVDISMAMMQTSMEMCTTEELPIDYPKYRELALAQAELAANQAWMRDLAEKLQGFPLRTDTTTTVMGKQMKSWQELSRSTIGTPPRATTSRRPATAR